MGANVSTTYISCPVSPSKTLGIKLPFLVMIIKNVKKYFTFFMIITKNGSFMPNVLDGDTGHDMYVVDTLAPMISS